MMGAHRSRGAGVGAEFTEYRLYRQGDDLRQLDWKLLARSDRAYVRLSEDQATIPTTILADASASMAYPVDSLAKWNMARSLPSKVHTSFYPLSILLPLFMPRYLFFLFINGFN